MNSFLKFKKTKHKNLLCVCVCKAKKIAHLAPLAKYNTDLKEKPYLFRINFHDIKQNKIRD